ncbi:MAG: insulinase family protein [Ignavibacteriales bacterium]|nr:insulinase family protein [Ignavibacteriales bacterium]
MAKSLTTDSNSVVMISYPEKEGIKIPSETALEKIYSEVKKTKISSPTVATTDRPLIKVEPVPGKIIKEEDFGILDIKKWTLDNGAVIYLKKTELQQDEVMMYGFSQGGLSKVETADLVSAKYSNSIIEESGLGDFNLTDLSKKLSGKMVSLTTGISDLSESIQGKTSLKDIEDFFRLIYLTFTNPRLDTEASDIFIDKMKNYLQNAGMSPDNVFYDTIVVSLFGNNPRMKPMSIDQLDQLIPSKSYQIFKERFNSASEFEFVFVGNFDEDILRSLVCRYIASQPKVEKETWTDRGVHYADKSDEKTVKMGAEQKATVFLSFPGKFEWTKKNAMELTTLQKIFDIQLNEVIREELGGSYSVSASTTYNKYPEPVFNNSVYFNCDPARVNELVNRVMLMIDSLKTSFADEATLTKAKENQYKEIDDTFQDNGSILNLISSYLLFDADLKDFLQEKKL